MTHYYIWTIGCQMNTADSEKIADILKTQGFQHTPAIDKASIIVVNSCIVRQKAENKAISLISSLKPLKKNKRDAPAIAVTGCLVDSNIGELKKLLPHVDIFFPPQEFESFKQWLERYNHFPSAAKKKESVSSYVTTRSPIAFLPVIKGCDSFCSYCIVPFRRGREVSRPVAELVEEARCLASRGVREITLLGQTVDSYGHDLAGKPDLADLLVHLEEIPGLYRLRFLTSHPKFLKQKLINTISRLKKACPFFNLPVQSGDDTILSLMKRGYTIEEYRKLIHSIRDALKESAICTDIIVGFPGEKEEHFENTLRLLEEMRFDNIHVAAYSPRPGTRAAREMRDDITLQEKKRRLEQVEKLHERIAGEINSSLLDKTVEVLVESEKKGKWMGRTTTNKLVFFNGPENLAGKLAQVKINRTGPWSMTGELESVKI